MQTSLRGQSPSGDRGAVQYDHRIWCAPSRSGGRMRVLACWHWRRWPRAPRLWPRRPRATADAAPAPSPVFAIKGFKVTGENPLGEAETARVLAPYRAGLMPPSRHCRRPPRRWKRRCATKAIGLHRVALPPQEVGDTVTLNIVKFNIAKVNIEGPQHLRRGQYPAQPAGTAGRATVPISSSWPSRRPSPTRTPTSRSRWACAKSDEPDQIDATITVKELRPWTFAVGLSNGGSESTGQRPR